MLGFGDEVAVSGTHLAVSATADGPAREGHVELYEGGGAAWAWVHQVVGPHGEARIGLDTLALDGDLLAIPVGSGHSDHVQVEVYEYVAATGWQLLWVLDDPAYDPIDYGHPVVDLVGNTLLFGMPYTSHFASSTGALYRYDDIRSGQPPVPLRDPDRVPGLYLGHSVAQRGDTVLSVGDPTFEIYVFSPDTVDPAW